MIYTLKGDMTDPQSQYRIHHVQTMNNKEVLVRYLKQKAIENGAEWIEALEHAALLGDYFVWADTPVAVVAVHSDSAGIVSLNGRQSGMHNLDGILEEQIGYFARNDSLRPMTEEEKHKYAKKIRWFENNGIERKVEKGTSFTVDDQYQDTRFRNQTVEIIDDMGEFVLIGFNSQMEAVERRVAEYLIKHAVD